jgi:CTP:molybdopterin cytidylyltransferase MocA
VLLARRAFAEVCRLEGDEGAGRSLKTRDDVAVVAVNSARIHLDVDRAEDLARLREAPLDKD